MPDTQIICEFAVRNTMINIALVILGFSSNAKRLAVAWSSVMRHMQTALEILEDTSSGSHSDFT
jgi:transposase-like protein